jgi:heterotetrameric sarcosine oxidase delta subunit
MLRINCPWCGTRDEPEFSFGHETHVTRPGPDSDDDTWSDYLFNTDNPKGVHYELWLHKFGCGRWFNVARDTVSHEIYAVYKLGEPKPEIPGKNR